MRSIIIAAILLSGCSAASTTPTESHATAVDPDRAYEEMHFSEAHYNDECDLRGTMEKRLAGEGWSLASSAGSPSTTLRERFINARSRTLLLEVVEQTACIVSVN